MKKSLSEMKIDSKWEVCEALFKRHCNFGLCDPLLFVMWRGTDINGDSFLSFFESFYNYNDYDQKHFYNDLINKTYDKDYKEKEQDGVNVATKVELSRNIELRLKKFQKNKKKQRKKKKTENE